MIWFLASIADSVIVGVMTKQEELRDRTKKFTLRVVKMFQALPKTTETQVMGKQVLRFASSVAANYRACGRARSKADFASKLAIVLEEADETVFWMECLVESGTVRQRANARTAPGGRELLAIFAASHNTLRHSRKQQMAKSDGQMAR
ncbi:MAG: four helix bundle protein [Terriglobales bacterium]